MLTKLCLLLLLPLLAPALPPALAPGLLLQEQETRCQEEGDGPCLPDFCCQGRCQVSGVGAGAETEVGF